MEKYAQQANQDDVDLLEEARDLALSMSAIYQQDLRRYHSRRMHPLAFREGDLVLRLIQDTKGLHKLSSPWEGPFVVSRALSNNAYYIIDMREPRKDKGDTSYNETERPCNVDLLCLFYT